MVITITGIIAAMVAVFIRSPIDAYVDTARRAMLTDIADTAARRITRELQAALPNSARVDGAGSFLEFVPIVAAGRYRAEAGPAAAPGNPLDFTTADNRFDVLGPPVTVPAGGSLVVYNLGIPGAASVYDSPVLTVRRAATPGAFLSQVSFTATGTPLPFPSPGSRFQIVGTPVSFACDLDARTLWRYTGYAFQPNQPADLATLNGLAGVTRAALATNVTQCVFNAAAGVLQHNGLVSIRLTLTQAGESVTLQQQVNVDNVP